MKKIFRLGAAALAAVMMCVLSASAINVTFINEPKKEPDLFITKTVEPAVDGYDAPNDTFTFFVKVNGVAYGNEYYFPAPMAVTIRSMMRRAPPTRRIGTADCICRQGRPLNSLT